MKALKLTIIVLFALGLFFLPTISSVDAKGINWNPFNWHPFNGHSTDVNNQNNNNNDRDTKTGNQICGNEGFNCECQNFYNSADYYAIDKWSYDAGKCNGKGNYKVDETNSLYSYFKINVTGNLKAASWTSSPTVYSALVKAGNNIVEFSGGASGSVSSVKDISHITFCGHKTNDGGCTGPNCGSNGVPEFPALTIGLAVLAVTLGLVFLRKN